MPEPDAGDAGSERADRSADGAPTVLVVGTDDWAVDLTVPLLERDGCHVLRCHEPGEPAFPCNALLPGRTCPLEEGFDVVVNVRARALSTLAPGEFGVVCALHDDVPMVVAGVAYEQPLAPWTTQVVERGGDVASAARAAVAVRLRR